jgi:hypothetical protein
MRRIFHESAQQVLLPLFVLCAAVVLGGCATTGAFNALNATNVQLSEGNYEIVATNVEGEASAGYVFGLSATTARQLRTIALARVTGSGQLYGDALKDLWANFEAQHGEVEGRELALTNVRYDVDSLNLLVYTQPTVSVRADIVRFVE